MANNEQDTVFNTYQQIVGEQLFSDSASLFESSMGATLDELVSQAGEIASGGGQSSSRR
jgi:hypothetical protein